jgi:hypothetical protein
MNIALKSHKFSVGQTVYYVGPFAGSRVGGALREKASSTTAAKQAAALGASSELD